jgi:hypothetical protein
MWDRIKGFVGGCWNGMKGRIRGFWDGIKGWIRRRWDGIKGRFRRWWAARKLSFNSREHGDIEEIQGPDEAHELEEARNFETQTADRGRTYNKRAVGDGYRIPRRAHSV